MPCCLQVMSSLTTVLHLGIFSVKACRHASALDEDVSSTVGELHAITVEKNHGALATCKIPRTDTALVWTYGSGTTRRFLGMFVNSER